MASLSRHASGIIQEVMDMKRSDIVWPEHQENLELFLQVVPINDEDPSIRYCLRNRETRQSLENSDRTLRLSRFNPLLFRRQLRKAEGIAIEVWSYYASSVGKDSLSCVVQHYHD